jgi:hypothetical protein
VIVAWVLAGAAMAPFIRDWLHDRSELALWIGHFPLRVDLVTRNDRQIVDVSCDLLPKEYATYLRKAWADDPQIDPEKLELTLHKAEWIEGQPFTVDVTSSGATTRSGREIGYWQRQLLVLRVEYKDGGTEYVAEEIPDGRARRDVSVSVP